MSEYCPDKWLVIKLNYDTGSHYRVFGSWYGGYLGSDSWRMNSGIVSVTEDDNCYYFKGTSGSTYACHKNSYGASGYGTRVLEDMIDKQRELYQTEIDILADSTNFITLDYKDTYGTRSSV